MLTSRNATPSRLAPRRSAPVSTASFSRAFARSAPRRSTRERSAPIRSASRSRRPPSFPPARFCPRRATNAQSPPVTVIGRNPHSTNSLPVSLQSDSVASKNEQRWSTDCRMAQRSRTAALNRTFPNSQDENVQPVSRASDQSTSWKAQSSYRTRSTSSRAQSVPANRSLAIRRSESTAASMEEVPGAGQVHGQARLLGCLQDQIVADRAAGLDHRPYPGTDQHLEAVREREVRIGGGHRAAGPLGAGPGH